MKFNKVALAAAIYCAVYGGTVSAAGLRQPSSVQQTNYAHSYYDQGDAQASPSDVPAPIVDNAPLAYDGAAFDGGACDVCAEPEAEVCEPWRLFNQDRSVKVYGWVNGGIFTNSRNTDSNYNGPVTFADRNDGQINQLYGVIEKTIDTGGCGWDFGGRFDVLYGTDWVYNTQVGWETDPATGALLDGWNSSPYYGLVTPQAYGEIGYNDLSVKVGRFYTPIGYEVVTAPNNFFATHAYTMQYGEPFSHTGALATWKYSDNWSFIGGLVNGWDRFDGPSDRVAGIGGVVYTPDHERYTLTLTGISGQEANSAGNIPLNQLYSTRNMYSLVFNYSINDRWNYVFQHDHGWQKDFFEAAPTPGAGLADAEWYGINQYLFYTINDCWKAGLRAEWFRDDDGARVAGVRPDNGTDLGNVSATPGGYAGNFYEISLGLNWTPHANLIVRPEVRYDWYEGEQLNGAAPFGDGTESSQWVYGLDAVVLW